MKPYSCKVWELQMSVSLTTLCLILNVSKLTAKKDLVKQMFLEYIAGALSICLPCTFCDPVNSYVLHCKLFPFNVSPIFDNRKDHAKL